MSSTSAVGEKLIYRRLIMNNNCKETVLCCNLSDIIIVDDNFPVTSAVEKPFEGISKAVCESISHSRPDNVNGYRTDEDFFVNGYDSEVRTADDVL